MVHDSRIWGIDPALPCGICACARVNFNLYNYALFCKLSDKRFWDNFKINIKLRIYFSRLQRCGSGPHTELCIFMGKAQSRPPQLFPHRTGKHAALSIKFTLYFTKPFKKTLHVFPCGGQVGVARGGTCG